MASSLSAAFTAIANAIRAKKGVSTTYTPDEMPDAIASIATATLQTKTTNVTPSANWSGTNTNTVAITPDSGYDGMSQVNVSVPMLRDYTLMTADTVDTPSTVYSGNTSQSNSQKLLRMKPTKDGMSYTGSYLYMQPNSYLGNASASDVLSGKTFSSSNGIQITGTGSGGTTPTGTKYDTYTSNGTYTPDVTNYATHSVTVNVSGTTPSGTKSDTYTSNGTYSVDVTNYATHSITVNVANTGKQVDVRTVSRNTSSKATYTIPFNPAYTIGYHNSYKAMFYWDYKSWGGNQLLARTNKYLTYCTFDQKDGVYGMAWDGSNRVITLMESSSSTMAGDWTIVSVEY